MAKKTASRTRGGTRSTGRTPGPKPDALEILVLEHRRFEALLAQGEATTERARKGRRQLLDSLVSELTAHERMEEQVLYPALLSYSHTRETLTEGLHEHDSAEAIVNELRDISTDDAEWGVRFRVLKEILQHHMDHEEKHLFPVARGVFSREELRDLAEQMLASRPPRRSPTRRR
ncbi:MAG TPA: hemerythrin domain-containing protein [Vicinamibacterales bacterium]|nr:hemerythrin domain-containing protein [Vicinamibacterales bacterium]